ncbi:N-formylglutamate amidohydrolase [Leifsonia sp. YAF41]|uniref:N-formylglutamate amidohydrolase n=1 Tax=Leifsonia sp. YAF41 TaxID=3233086 RepID=UPI003F9DCC4B
MTDAGAPLLIPVGTVFTASDITFYADPDDRDLEQAIEEADLLVSCPHAGAAIPEELAQFLHPAFTRRLQFDFSDHSTSAIVRRWAEIDPRIVYVENPHPRMVRDPNREKPADLRATLREAFARVAEAGAGNPVDLSGVDGVRPVTFSNFPLLLPPVDAAALNRLADTFTEVATHGVGIYETTRDALIERFVEIKLERARGGDTPHSFSTLSFHDTMNHTTTPDGAVDVPRDEADRLPSVVALSNRGDADGEPRGESRGDDPLTMRPDLMRSLAAAHRIGFAVDSPEAVALNKPYLGGFEIIRAGARFRELAPVADAAGLVLSAVQAEFRREYLLGRANTRAIMQPGTGWVDPDPQRVDRIAQACKASWDRYRAATRTTAFASSPHSPRRV